MSKDGQKITSYLDFFQNEDYDPFYDITGHDRDDMKKSMEYMPDALGKAPGGGDYWARLGRPLTHA